MFTTKKGDNGYTGILGPGRVPKYDLRIEAVGSLDEASSAIGLARAKAQGELKNILLTIQEDLGSITAQIADLEGKTFRMEGKLLDKLEKILESLEKKVKIPDKFVYPGDNELSASLDFARAVVRRAERRLDELFHLGYLKDEEIIRYINRLSSLLYLMARYAEK